MKTITKDNKNRYYCEIYTGHNIDLKNIMSDLKIAFGDMYNNTYGKKRDISHFHCSHNISNCSFI